jgi:hypothetical protein
MRNSGALGALAGKVIAPDYDMTAPQKQLKPEDEE